MGAGSSSVAGEEDRRTLDLLLSTPVPRSRVVVDKALAMVVGTLGLSALLGLALVAEGALVGMDLPAGNVAAAMLHLGLLGLVFGSLALAIGAGTGRLGLSRAVPVFVAVVAYVVNGLGGLVDWLAPLQKLSPFYQYASHDPLRNGVSWLAVGVAVGTVVAARGRGSRRLRPARRHLVTSGAWCCSSDVPVVARSAGWRAGSSSGSSSSGSSSAGSRLASSGTSS